MRAPAGLVREHDANAFGDQLVFRRGRAQDAGDVVRVGQCHTALAAGHCLDLVGVAAFGRARHVGHHAFEESLGLGFPQVLGQCAKQRQVVRVCAGTGTHQPLVFGVGQRLVGADVRTLDLQFVKHNDPGAGGKAEPGGAVGRGCRAQFGRNGSFQRWRLDRHEQAVVVAFPQSGGIHQQNHIGRRRRAFGFETRQNTGVISVHPVDLDAGGFGEIGIQRLVGLVMAGRIEVDHLILRHSRAGQSDAGRQRQARHRNQGKRFFEHGKNSVWQCETTTNCKSNANTNNSQ